MIDNSIIYARIKRTTGWSHAGKYFKIPPNVPYIGDLSGDDILLMLYRNDDCWTALSRRNLYFKVDGNYGFIPIKEAGSKIQEYRFSVGKNSTLEYVDLTDKKIWVVNIQTCCALENIILLLERHI
jgi:hypothetical protein